MPILCVAGACQGVSKGRVRGCVLRKGVRVCVEEGCEGVLMDGERVCVE